MGKLTALVHLEKWPATSVVGRLLTEFSGTVVPRWMAARSEQYKHIGMVALREASDPRMKIGLHFNNLSFTGGLRIILFLNGTVRSEISGSMMMTEMIKD
ncbi:hypothetical protein PG996_011672 [Apiospora saccharicola]|uniref:Uncharacterized protein n=1 Tax=Apiospora saccharicola TaxID=335842 RepID=A0ABR1UFQ2_9PEZI